MTKNLPFPPLLTYVLGAARYLGSEKVPLRRDSKCQLDV